MLLYYIGRMKAVSTGHRCVDMLSLYKHPGYKKQSPAQLRNYIITQPISTLQIDICSPETFISTYDTTTRRHKLEDHNDDHKNFKVYTTNYHVLTRQDIFHIARRINLYLCTML
jgi:hypothetical protein